MNVRCDTYHAILSVSDVRAAVDFYVSKLGFKLAFAENDPPTFAGLNLDCVQVFLERGTPAPDGCALYFVVDDADAMHRAHAAAGVEVIQEPGDRPYKLRDYTVRDGDGYRLTFGHRL